MYSSFLKSLPSSKVLISCHEVHLGLPTFINIVFCHFLLHDHQSLSMFLISHNVLGFLATVLFQAYHHVTNIHADWFFSIQLLYSGTLFKIFMPWKLLLYTKIYTWVQIESILFMFSYWWEEIPKKGLRFPGII